MKSIIPGFVALLLVTITSCNKNNDVGGTEKITGTLYYSNTLTGINDTVKLPKTELFIQYSKMGTSSYLYKVITDTSGKFTFTNLKKTEEYLLFTTFEKDGIKYIAKNTVKPEALDTKVVLVPDESGQNGFLLSVIDNNQKSPVANFKLWVFTNKLLADNNDTAGFVFSLKTNDYGKAFKLGLQPGNYYINAKDSFGVVRLRGKKAITVPNPGIAKDIFELEKF